MLVQIVVTYSEIRQQNYTKDKHQESLNFPSLTLQPPQHIKNHNPAQSISIQPQSLFVESPETLHEEYTYIYHKDRANENGYVW